MYSQPYTPEDLGFSHTVRLPKHRNVFKDTVQFLCLMLSKLKFLREAKALTHDEALVWIDLRIFHVVRSVEGCSQKLREIADMKECPTKVILPGFMNGQHKESIVLDSIQWKYCGGLFWCHRSLLDDVFNTQERIVRENAPKLTWEVNYWAAIEKPGVWQVYDADHNDSMILNFPTCL